MAGVDIVAHRGWSGARRTGTDLAEDVETDGRALHAITGHMSDDMRRRIYQEKVRDAVLAKARRRGKLRVNSPSMLRRP